LNNIIGGLAEIGIWKHSGVPAALKSMKKVKQKWTYRIGRRRRRGLSFAAPTILQKG